MASALGALASVNSIVTLGLEIGSVTIPLIKGLITKIESAKSGGTVTYTVLIQADEAVLAGDVQVNIADLVAINAELQRLQQPPLAVPTEPAPPAPAV